MDRYIALRAFRLPDGSAIVAGDEVPGAAEWRNPRVWVDSRYIRLAKPGELEPEVTDPTEPEPAAPPAVPDGATPLEALAAMLGEVAAGSDHTKTEMIALAEAAGVDIPESVPRARVDLAELLAASAGFIP